MQKAQANNMGGSPGDQDQLFGEFQTGNINTGNNSDANMAESPLIIGASVPATTVGRVSTNSNSSGATPSIMMSASPGAKSERDGGGTPGKADGFMFDESNNKEGVVASN